MIHGHPDWSLPPTNLLPTPVPTRPPAGRAKPLCPACKRLPAVHPPVHDTYLIQQYPPFQYFQSVPSFKGPGHRCRLGRTAWRQHDPPPQHPRVRSVRPVLLQVLTAPPACCSRPAMTPLLSRTAGCKQLCRCAHRLSGLALQGLSAQWPQHAAPAASSQAIQPAAQLPPALR